MTKPAAVSTSSRLRRAALSMAGVALGYGLTLWLLRKVGARALLPLLLELRPPPYGSERPLLALLLVLFWLLISGLAHRLLIDLGGRGSLEETTAAVGLSLATITLLSLAPDALLASLCASGHIDPDLWLSTTKRPDGLHWPIVLYLAVYGLVLVSLLPERIRRVHGLSWPLSLLAGVASGLTYVVGLVMVVR